jgi:hypothetical protein
MSSFIIYSILHDFKTRIKGHIRAIEDIYTEIVDNRSIFMILCGEREVEQ